MDLNLLSPIYDKWYKFLATLGVLIILIGSVALANNPSLWGAAIEVAIGMIMVIFSVCKWVKNEKKPEISKSELFCKKLESIDSYQRIKKFFAWLFFSVGTGMIAGGVSNLNSNLCWNILIIVVGAFIAGLAGYNVAES